MKDCFDGWKRKPHSKYYEVIKAHASDEDAKQAILEMWETNRKEAARLGTATHKAVELLLGGAPLEACGNPEVEPEINAFLAWHAKKRERVDAEATELGWTDAEDKLCLGGSIDAIFVNDEHVLVDWKRNGSVRPRRARALAKLGSGRGEPRDTSSTSTRCRRPCTRRCSSASTTSTWATGATWCASARRTARRSSRRGRGLRPGRRGPAARGGGWRRRRGGGGGGGGEGERPVAKAAKATSDQSLEPEPAQGGPRGEFGRAGRGKGGRPPGFGRVGWW